MSERGYIALARGMLDHPIVGVERNKPYSRTEAWEWLLLEASFKPRRYDAGGTVIDLQRGQVAHSTRYIANAWRWPETNVRRFLRRLKTGAGTGAMIGAESGAGITVITICNYDRYQSATDESGAASGAADGAASGAKVAHERRRKEQGNNRKKDIAPGKMEPEGFADWYSVYPRKKARKDAARAFGKLIEGGESPLDDLMTRTRAFAAAWAARPKAEHQFVPYPASWLNSGEYLDEPESLTTNGGNSIKITTPTKDPATFTETEWRERLRGLDTAGEWSSLWGPRPGADGCIVPPHLIGGGDARR